MQKKDERPVIASFHLSSRSVVLPAECPGSRPAADCRPTPAAIQIITDASSPAGGELYFDYYPAAGAIYGQGHALAVWDLSRVAPGRYNIHLQVIDERKNYAQRKTSVTVTRCGCAGR